MATLNRGRERLGSRPASEIRGSPEGAAHQRCRPTKKPLTEELEHLLEQEAPKGKGQTWAARWQGPKDNEPEGIDVWLIGNGVSLGCAFIGAWIAHWQVPCLK
jgi:hypothetical protein